MQITRTVSNERNLVNKLLFKFYDFLSLQTLPFQNNKQEKKTLAMINQPFNNLHKHKNRSIAQDLHEFFASSFQNSAAVSQIPILFNIMFPKLFPSEQLRWTLLEYNFIKCSLLHFTLQRKKDSSF